LNDGTRIRWIGRCTIASLGPPMCAACGRASVGVAIVASEFPLERLIELNVGTRPGGEVRRTGALGHPHSGTPALPREGSGPEYAGSAVLACVAWQERTWNGESMEISKCRLLVGSFGSGFDKRMTSYDALVYQGSN